MKEVIVSTETPDVIHQPDSEFDLDFEPIEPETISGKLNWLRAGVLGANDGIVSTAGIVVGVSGASMTGSSLLAAGVAGVVAGALSMAAGEYVSVSTQRDTEKAALDEQRRLIDNEPKKAEKRLAGLVAGQGISKPVSARIARELSVKNPYKAHSHYELGMDEEDLVNPWHAALASMVSFVLGALIPLLAILLSPTHLAVRITVVAVTVALAITGTVSAKLGGAPVLPAIIRVVLWGNAAMLVTYFVGVLIGG